MASVQLKIKNLTVVTFVLAFLVASSVAEGVTGAESSDDRSSDTGHTLAAGVVARADADIQIRRIKTVMATKKSDIEKDIEQLEKLQKILHGQN